MTNDSRMYPDTGDCIKEMYRRTFRRDDTLWKVVYEIGPKIGAGDK